MRGKTSDGAGGLGLLLGPFPEVQRFDVMPTATMARADWGAIAAQTPLILAAVAMAVVGMLLNLTGVELATGRSANVDGDLRRTGLVNMLSGGLSGGSGYIYIGLTLLARNLGVLERSACLAAGIFCGFTLFAGPSFIGALPLCVFGGITTYLGVDLLYQWLWLERRRLPTIDFAIVFIILLVAASIGFLEGIAAGLVVSVAVFVHSCVGAPVVRRSFSNAARFSTVGRTAMDVEVLEANGDETRIYQLQGVLFFGTIYKLAKLISDEIAVADWPIRRVIIDFEHIQDLDTSAIQGMAKIAADCRRCDVDLWLCGLGRLPGRRQTEILSHLLDDDSPMAYSSLDEALESAEELTLERYGPLGRNPAQSVEPPLVGEEDIDEVAKFLERRVIPSGEPLITQGDETNAIYFLRRGVLSEECDDACSERVRAHFAGAVIGEMALYTGSQCSAHFVAATECEVLRLSLENLERMEREAPRIAIRLHRLVAEQICKRLHRTNSLIELLKA